MKRFLIVLFALVLALPEMAAEQLHYADTLKSPNKKAQFAKAIEMAPTMFVYSDFDTDGKTYSAVTGLRFNDSFKNVLKSDFAADDPGFRKRFKRLYNLLRPLNVTGDLKVTYETVPAGIAISYDLSNLKIWGRKAKTEEVDAYKKP